VPADHDRRLAPIGQGSSGQALARSFAVDRA
jgi:hypothetical protein